MGTGEVTRGARVDYGKWDVLPEQREDVERQARRFPAGWTIACGGVPQVLPLIVKVRDPDGRERANVSLQDFDDLATFLERAADAEDV